MRTLLPPRGAARPATHPRATEGTMTLTSDYADPITGARLLGRVPELISALS